jgi:uncharacterized membrane protein
MQQVPAHRWLKMVLFLLLVCIAQQAGAHTINYALEGAPAQHVVWYYLKLGFQHILPEGLDHILFIIGLCLITTRIKTMLWQATAFTVAHTITLALTMKNVIVAPSALVEPIIALSIMFVAVENILIAEVKPWRIAVVFLFGLIHGMGFANSLNEIGLPPDKFYTSIIAFNAGVEIGQIAVIAAVFGLLIVPLRNKSWYKKRIVVPLSLLIALIALYWTIERL